LCPRCEQGDVVKVNRGEPHLPISSPRANNFSSKERLVEHYEKHGVEFRSKSCGDYLATARHVVNKGLKLNIYIK